MMRQAILNFPKQFEFNPQIINTNKFKLKSRAVAIGIGGSHLAADLVLAAYPEVNLIVHTDYGLPYMEPDRLKNSLIILVSYSGNTEEVVDAFMRARQKKLDTLVISTGGKLQELAVEYKTPYITLPATGIQPRMAVGFSFRAILKAVGADKLLAESKQLARILKAGNFEQAGEGLAKKFEGYVPIIYSSGRNLAVTYNWKIKFNETGKVPAFYNILPELNHNEMTGFDVISSTRPLSKKFKFLFLSDSDDNERIVTRMEVLQKLYEDRKLPVEVVKMNGGSRLEKIFSSLILADWTAFYTSELYGTEATEVPMVEEFKKIIA